VMKHSVIGKKIFQSKSIDSKEFVLPETLFVRDIETRVFQAIALQCLKKIEGVALIPESLFESIFSRDNLEGVQGIYVEQDLKKQCVRIKIEVGVYFGVCIPEKSEEIQMTISQEVMRMTGLHVSSIHVVIKSVLPKEACITLAVEKK
jgi:uncharacterized alkaline shock family protein YloU